MKFVNIKNIVGTSILVGILIVLICFARWEYMWDGRFLSKWASLIAIISFGIAPVWYFWTKNHDERAKRKRASKSLHTELIDTLESLDREKYSKEACSLVTNDNREIFFMSRKFNHDFYDSLIFSGHINFLRPELQQQVQNIFRQIKTHNKYLDLVGELQDEDKSGKIPEKTYKYYEWMDKNEVKLEKDIPIMLKKLEKDFNI